MLPSPQASGEDHHLKAKSRSSVVVAARAVLAARMMLSSTLQSVKMLGPFERFHFISFFLLISFQKLPVAYRKINAIIS